MQEIMKKNKIEKRLMTENLSNYQRYFNRAISRMRIATSASIMDNEPLMRTLCKIMYDFSDDLKKDEIIKEI